jgi:hypothetical protein
MVKLSRNGSRMPAIEVKQTYIPNDGLTNFIEKSDRDKKTED